MSWLERLLPGKPLLSVAHSAALEAYRRLPRVDANSPIDRLRFVVLDIETTGLNPWQDRLLAIGAIALENMLVRFADSYHAFVRQETPSAHENILVHGIGQAVQTSAPQAADGLIGFLEFAGKAPLVAYPADFDRTVVERVMHGSLGAKPDNTWLDLALLAPAYFPEHAGRARTLDDWTRTFGIEIYSRHDAVADALATAQLLQVVLTRATQSGVKRLRELTAYAKAQRWLEQQRPKH